VILLKFFVTPEEIGESSIILTGDDHTHISRTLRMRRGEKIVICDSNGTDFYCTISDIDSDKVIADIDRSERSESEASVKLTVFAAFPKGDKTDTIVQKCVELGASEIVFFLSERCISRPDEKSAKSKIVRLQRIALEAAKQSERGVIPKVNGIISYEDMLSLASGYDLPLFFFERGGETLKKLTEGKVFESICVITGPEGGFEIEEVERAKLKNIQIASLGKRILRCETAPLCAVSALMFATDNL